MLKTHIRKLFGRPEPDPFPLVCPPLMLRQEGWEKGTGHMKRWCSVVEQIREDATAAECLLQENMACYKAVKAFVSQLYEYIDRLQIRVYKKLMSGKPVSNKYYDWTTLESFQRRLKLAIKELGFSLSYMKYNGIYDDVEKKIIGIHEDFTKDGTFSVLQFVTKMDGRKMHQQILDLLEVDKAEYWGRLDEAGKSKQIRLELARRQEELIRKLKWSEQCEERDCARAERENAH